MLFNIKAVVGNFAEVWYYSMLVSYLFAVTFIPFTM